MFQYKIDPKIYQKDQGTDDVGQEDDAILVIFTKMRTMCKRCQPLYAPNSLDHYEDPNVLDLQY